MTEPMQDALLPSADVQQSIPVSVLRVGWPVCLQNLVACGSWLFTFVLLGKYTNETVMAGYALANTLCNLAGRFLILGVGAGFDTLASQAWGAREPVKLGIYAQRVLLILVCLVCIPLSVVWWFASPILVAAGQQSTIAEAVSQYSRISLPSLFCQAVTCVLSKSFLAMGHAQPVMISSVLMELTELGLLVPLVVRYHLQLRGAAFASLAATLVQSLSLLVFALRARNCRMCWPGWTRKPLYGWIDYLRLGVPACLMLLAETLSWDMVSFFAGLCHSAAGGAKFEPKAIVAAQGLLQAYIATSYCVPMGICRGVTTVIGNAVGAGDVVRASRASRFALISGGCSTALLVTLLTLLRDPIISAFGPPADVQAVMVTVMPYVAAFLLADGMQMCLTGVITGAGRQAVAMPILVVAYWVLGLPAGVAFAFARWPALGLLGLWLGMTLAVCLHAAAYFAVCYASGCRFAIQWERAVKEAQSRLADRNEPPVPSVEPLPTHGSCLCGIDTHQQQR